MKSEYTKRKYLDKFVKFLEIVKKRYINLSIGSQRCQLFKICKKDVQICQPVDKFVNLLTKL